MKGILIVDDSPTMRRMVITSLKNLKEVQFEEAGTGLEAIEKLALGKIHLVILDLNMPDMHGMEVLKFMQSHATFRDIAVLVLTTKGDDNSRSEALGCGAAAFLTKPFDPGVLAEQAGELLR